MNYKNVKLKDKYSFLLSLLIFTIILFNIFLFISINNKIKESQNFGLERHVTISGNAEILVEPDSVFINFTIIDRAQSIGEAINQNEEKMGNIIGIATILGVKREDIRIISFNVNPIRSDMYEAKRYFEIKVNNFDKIESIMKGVIANDVDNINNVRFSVNDLEVLKEKVRKEAFKNAEFQASQVSQQLEVSLGKIISFDESFKMPQFSIKSIEEIYKKDFQDYLDLGKIKSSVNVIYEIK